MANDVTFVPGDQDRLNVGKVLVQGCTPDPGFFCDLRHRHRPRPVLSYKGCGSVNDGFAHTDAVRLYGLVPVRRQPRIAWRRHSVSMSDTSSATLARVASQSPHLGRPDPHAPIDENSAPRT